MIKMELKKAQQLTAHKGSVFFYEFLAIGIVILIVLFSSCQRIQRNNGDLWLGVETIELNPELSAQYNIPIPEGLLVSRIFVGSPAEAAGMKTGDIIQRWDGISVTTHRQFEGIIRSSVLNRKNVLTVSRNDKSILVYVYLGIRPGASHML